MSSGEGGRSNSSDDDDNDDDTSHRSNGPQLKPPPTKQRTTNEVSLVRLTRRITEAAMSIMSYVLAGLLLVTAVILPQARLRELTDEPLDNKIALLRQVHVVFRHGERMPTSLYPTDLNKPSDFKDGLGRITLKGKRDMYAIGQRLRQRYRGFLTNDTNEMKARSSGRDRCIESMQTFLAALYQPGHEARFESDLNWQPVPVATMPVDIDGMLYEDAICRKDDEVFDELRTTGAGKEVMSKYKTLMERLQKMSGKKMTDWVSVRDLLDTLSIERSLGLNIPAWADEDTWRQMEECAQHTNVLNYANGARIRFRAGLLLKDMTMHFYDVVNKSPKHKIYAYSSHDVLVAAYLSAFGGSNGVAVPSSSTVLTELYEEPGGDFRIEMFFCNDTASGIFKPLHIPGCTLNGHCTLAEWLAKAAPFTPSDWREECGESALPVRLYDSH